MKTIALIEDSWGGHRPTYLKIFTKTLLELGHQVIVLCPKPAELSEWITQNHSYSDKFHAFEFHKPDPSSFPVLQFRLIINAIARWRNVKMAIESVALKLDKSPDLVFFPWLDSYLAPYLTHYAIDLIFPYQWSGLYFHPRHLRLKQKFWSICRGPLRQDAVLKSSRCKAIAVLDEGIAQKLQSKIGGKLVVTFPDFTDTSTPDPNYPIARQIKAKAQGRKIIGLLGLQSKRKGLLTLLEVARQTVKDYFFVFAGSLAEHTFTAQELANIQNIVDSDLSNCFCYFETIPDGAPFNALVDLCDILFAAYEKFPHSSNILTKTAILEKPVIVSKKFCMAERVEKFKLGLSIDEGDVVQCTQAIQYLSRQLEEQKLQPNFEDYRHLHSTKKLKTAFLEILDRYAINSTI